MSKNNNVGKLSPSTTVATRFLSLYSGMLLVMLCLGVNTLPAHARPIEIRDMYTTGKNFKNKVVFKPGKQINYHVDVDNTTGSTFPIDVRFQVFTAFNLDPTYYGYDQTIHVDQMPVGLTRFYNPAILPSDAKIYSGYILRVTVTESPCSGVDCNNDYGENRFAIQTTKSPMGKAPNLIVLVHGCCTYDVSEWNALADEIRTRINLEEWEVVVWDWHEYTPLLGEISPEGFRHAADAAYQNAKDQGVVLANAIKIHHLIYKHVHLIGHSAGAKLIHDAATAYISDYFIREQNPFIHLTFLDAYTPNEWDNNGHGSYGSLPTDYPNHYSEHYVDKTPGWPFTDADLTYAFNFDITDCPSSNPGFEKRDFGHQWPRYWYQNSVTIPGFPYGYPLSREGGNNQIANLAGLLGALKLQGMDCGDVPQP
jgi:hypothetical protein